MRMLCIREQRCSIYRNKYKGLKQRVSLGVADNVNFDFFIFFCNYYASSLLLP